MTDKILLWGNYRDNRVESIVSTATMMTILLNENAIILSTRRKEWESETIKEGGGGATSKSVSSRHVMHGKE